MKLSAAGTLNFDAALIKVEAKTGKRFGRKHGTWDQKIL